MRQAHAVEGSPLIIRPDGVTHPSPPTKSWPMDGPAPSLIPLPFPEGEGDGYVGCTELPGTVTSTPTWATDAPVPTLIEVGKRQEETHPKPLTKTWSMGVPTPSSTDDGCPGFTELPGVLATTL
jgi:hypothetical protein